MVDDEECESEGCGELVDCYVCDACAAHCALHDPQACWDAHESWRLGRGDPAIVSVLEAVPATGRPVTLNGKPVPPAPRPRVRS
jgi:hypothetical protein